MYCLYLKDDETVFKNTTIKATEDESRETTKERRKLISGIPV